MIEGPTGDSGLQVEDTYGDGTVREPGQAFVRCGEEHGGKGGQGCGAMIPLEDYSQEPPDLPGLRQETCAGPRPAG